MNTDRTGSDSTGGSFAAVDPTPFPELLDVLYRRPERRIRLHLLCKDGPVTVKMLTEPVAASAPSPKWAGRTTVTKGAKDHD